MLFVTDPIVLIRDSRTETLATYRFTMKIEMRLGTMVALIGSVIGRNLLPVKQCGASSENECCHADMQINSQKGATKNE